MDWKEFLKPDKRKIILFVIIYLLTPFPFVVSFTIKSNELRNTYYTPFGAPLNLFTHIIAIVYGMLKITNSSDLIIFILALVFPFISYFISSLIVWSYDNYKKKPKLLSPE